MRKIIEKNKMLLQLKNRIGRLRFIWSMNPALFGILLFTVMIVVGSLPVPAYADTIRLGGTGGALGGMKLLAEEFKKSGGKIYQEVGAAGAGESAPVTMRAAAKD